MLKALELVGFKSFADRTRFDFPDGITVVVGPNGSGKSNVVDAVKWVLGAQSAKALRGADMADVIFKGSAEGGRKPANSAEVILILDNTTRIFGHDADEVQVSRRVFRSGEGEYGINGQPCRLKDVKDLFRGTGVGVDAYSLIEQGKVDRLLQASAKDRRGIFEEAAGISRFKAKKVEAERRLLRVDQNMVRLNDIVDEVGKRLTTLKNQATKAQRYRELTQTMQTKRMQLGWLDRMALEEEKERCSKLIVEATTASAELAEKLKSLQAVVDNEQAVLQGLQQQQDLIQAEYLEAQRELIFAENGYKSSTERCVELAAEQTVLEERILLLQQRANLSSEEIEQKRVELAEIERVRQVANGELAESEARLGQLQLHLSSIRTRLDEVKAEQERAREFASENRSQLSAFHFQLEQIQHSIDQHQRLVEQAIVEMTQVEDSIVAAIASRDIAARNAERATKAKREQEEQLQLQRMTLTQTQEQFVLLQGKKHGVRERLHVLEQLEEQFTGAGRGGQQFLRLARSHQNPDQDLGRPTDAIVANAWGTVLGIVADLLSTEMHLAPLIDVALGSSADAIVLSNGQVVDWINDGSLGVEGRVTLLRMDRLTSRRTGEKIQLDGLRGVLGRADRMTRFDDAYEPLVRFLLGTTWFVDTLSTALELSHFRGAGLRFVTAECQLIDSDGSITLGSLQTGLGLVSRRSEMQSAREEIKHVEASISEATAAVANAQIRISETEQLVRMKDAAAYETSRELTSCDLKLESIEAHRSKLIASLETNRTNLQNAQARVQEIRDAIRDAQVAIVASSKRNEELERRREDTTQEFTKCELEMHNEQGIVTERRIELARLEQRLVGLRTTMEQLQLDSEERAKNVSQSEATLLSIANRISASTDAAAEFQNRTAAAYGIIETIEARRSESSAHIQAQNQVLQQALRQSEQARRSIEKSQDRIQAVEQHQVQLNLQWDQLHDHYIKEYELNLDSLALAALEHLNESSEPTQTYDSNAMQNEESQWLTELIGNSKKMPRVSDFDRTEIETDIVQLRHEIASAGSVNMEALAELDELQMRFNRLSNHYQDLHDAKASLIKTMAKIDEDSRDLFVETLTTIRKNFQELYRRSFGGGFADIVLEDERDPDSGIEIIATPPGKTTLSNSLLSGGEKALTAVALIMAFFQYRPSPFCILDEVDAPFDEANIGRFVTVLKEFLDTTKFIVVTHSKKTMTAANMIYGITMQESGVSRQVSVRFEEVGDKGEILSAPKRAA
jgi:chromosome segregation protein